MRFSHYLIAIFASMILVSCKIRIVVPEGGNVGTVSGAYGCAWSQTCDIDVVDFFFDETFTAHPSAGYKFKFWKKGPGRLCGWDQEPCRVYTTGFEENTKFADVILSFLESDEIFWLQPVFEPENPEDPCVEGSPQIGSPPANSFPVVVTETGKTATILIDVVAANGPPVLKMSMRGLEHRSEMEVYINGRRYEPDARWDGAESQVKTAMDTLPAGMIRAGKNAVCFNYNGSSRDTTKSFTIEALELAFDATVPMPPDSNSTLGVVSPEDWNPRDVKHITNPDSLNHPGFTALLQRGDLHWADSLRPYTNTKLLHDFYYGERRNSGTNKPLENPRMSYDSVKQASRLDFVVGEKGQLGTYQTRIEWPAIGPDDADMVTVQWQMLMYKDGIRGGKQFQIAAGDSLHYEYNAYYKTGQADVAGAWATVPVVRVYDTSYIGEKGLGDRLVSDRPVGCAGVNRCASQPALPFGSPKVGDGAEGNMASYTLADHISLGGTAYLTGDEDLSGWITVTVTFDWRDPANHKVWQWLSDERTPPTLVIGTDTDNDGWGDDGYRLGYGGKSAIDSFWLEFNNSSTVNTAASHIWVRNIAVVKGSILPLSGTH